MKVGNPLLPVPSLFFVVKNTLLFAAALLQHKALGGWIKHDKHHAGRGYL
jgi:hypothetical protein